MTDRLAELSDLGVSIWLDDLSREALKSGELANRVETEHVVGVTTNPAIFDKSITGGSEDYATQIRELGSRGVSVDEAVRALTEYDVRWACDVLAPVADRTEFVDGRVSIEVDPRLAHKTEATVAEAKDLHWAVDRPNVLIKIPATLEGLPAITAVLGQGISVNVTLIFSVERYEKVIDAWLSGLEQAQANGLDLSKIISVASFFVSRVDTNIDAQLDGIGGDALELKGKAGVANARLAWAAYERAMASDRWLALKAAGARPQRPLWASTGVKDPAFPADLYVVELAAPGCVNTMPEATLAAVKDAGNVHGDTVSGTADESQAVFDALAAAGIDLDAVFADLEAEGVSKFIDAWQGLLDNLQQALDSAAS